MDWFYNIRLTDGPVYWGALVLGLLGAAVLLLPPRRGSERRLVRWLVTVVAVGLLAFALVQAVHWALINMWSVFPENIPDTVLAWLVPAVAAFLLVLLHWRRTSWRTRGLSLVAFVLVGLLSAVQINAYFGLNRTVSDLLGTAVANVQDLEPALMRQAGAPDGGSRQGWQPQGELPAGGELRKSAIPGTVSGFDAREAYIYLPPAYFAANRPALPVLVLVAGQPGGPADWLTGGALRGHMDTFAAAHGGVAPVVVIPDPNGSQNANTMCLDSKIAQADTYLAKDVTQWISATLAVDTNHASWAIGGFSFGGTCAIQMGTRHPDLFPAVVGFSSEVEPAVAKERQKTIDASFPGDAAAFDRQTPLAMMATERFDGHGMYLTAGQDDTEFVGYLKTLAAAAEAAGFTVRAYQVEHAGHSWDTSSRRIADALDFLAQRWGMTP